MKRISLLLLCLLIGIGWASAQTAGKVVSGTVIAGDDNSPIAGATVRAKDTPGKGTLTDIDGKFRLIVPGNEKVIIISFVGYKSREVEAKRNLRVVLQPSTEALEEVLVVAYGKTTKQAFTGSAATISGEKLQLKSQDVTKALEGEIPGVQVINRSGQPGLSADIIVRGIGSVNSDTSPLYVVDGVPYGNSMSGIDPADIASLSVLKDASATALYGARAANGVVLITTRGGREGKTRVEAEVKYGINMRTIPLHDVITSPEEYLEMAYQSVKNKYDPKVGGVSLVNKKGQPIYKNGFVDELFDNDNGMGHQYNMWNVEAKDLINPQTGKFNPNVKRRFTPESWRDNVFHVGKRTEATVRMSGGSNRNNYYTSLGYLSDEGYYIGSDFERLTARSNLNFNVNDALKTSMNVSYSYSKMDKPGQTDSSNNGFAFVNAIPPIYPVFEHDEDGKLVPDPRVPGENKYDYGEGRRHMGMINPAGAVQLDRDKIIKNSLSINANATYTFLGDFQFASNVGYQYQRDLRNTLTNPYYGDAKNIGRLYRTSTDDYSLTFNQILSWAHKYDLHNLDAFIAHESFSENYGYQYDGKSMAVLADQLELNNFVKMDDITSWSLGYALESYFGQFRYDYDNRYFLSVSIRRDGSSRFKKGNRWGTFGSMGVAWLMTGEEFMQSAKPYINSLKLKASWGRVGNQSIMLGLGEDIPNYYLWEDFYSVSNLSDLPAFKFYSKGNKDLTWEVSNSINAGIEARFFDRMNLNVDWFSRTTTDMLFMQQVAPSQGFAYLPVNDGALLNTGIEADLNADIVKTDDFRFGVRLNLAHYTNRLTKMPFDKVLNEPQKFKMQGDFGWAEGHSIYDFIARKWIGVNKENGQPQYAAYIDTKEKDPEKKYVTNLQEWLAVKGHDMSQLKPDTISNATKAVRDFNGKSAIPDVTGGFGVDLEYKGVSLSSSFAFGIGGWAYDGVYQNLMNSVVIGTTNWHKDMLNAWTPENPNSDIPANVSGVNPYTYANYSSDRFLTSRSYLSISNVRLAYSLPKSWLERASITGLSLYLSGDNLYYFTARRGFYSGHSISGGRDHGDNVSVRSTQRYLPYATFTAGMKVVF